MKYVTTISEKQYVIEINTENQVTVDGRVLTVDLEEVHGLNLVSLLLEGNSYEAIIEEADHQWRVLLNGHRYEITVQDERAVRLAKTAGAATAQSGDFTLKSPMPGLVVTVPVSEGQAINKGTVLIILESMKMQNEFKSPVDGVVQRIRVQPGQTIEQNYQCLTVVANK